VGDRDFSGKWDHSLIFEAQEDLKLEQQHGLRVTRIFLFFLMYWG
jgi:hypothetical protein